jgi:hypothetical protein
MEKEKAVSRRKPNFAAKEIAHVALKVRTETNGNTIKEHTKVVEKYGVALLGKMGQAIGTAFRNSLNDQIERGVRTYLFLTIREGWHGSFSTYQCLLRKVSASLDEEKKLFVPKYYVYESPTIKTWFEISSIELMTRENMNRIYVLTSGRSIMSVMNSSATIFRVGIETSKSNIQLENDGEKNES